MHKTHTNTRRRHRGLVYEGGGGAGAQKPKAFTERQKSREGEEYERGVLKIYVSENSFPQDRIDTQVTIDSH